MITYISTQFWIVFSLFFLLFELGAPGLFYALAFSLGALSAALTCFFGFCLFTQLSSFLLASVMAVFLLRRVVKGLSSTKPELQTNVAALIGKQALVVKTETEVNPAQVKVAGQLWTAQSVNEEPLINNQLVTIIRVTGVTLFVQIKK